MFVYEIIRQVQDANRGICERIAERTLKAKQWWNSHAHELSSLNPLSHGKKSPADHYVDYCQLYEDAAPGAGLMLSELIADELRSRFTLTNPVLSQRQIRQDVLKEATEALHALDDIDFEEATLNKLNAIRIEVQQMVDKGMQTVGSLTTLIKQRETRQIAERAEQRRRFA